MAEIHKNRRSARQAKTLYRITLVAGAVGVAVLIVLLVILLRPHGGSPTPESSTPPTTTVTTTVTTTTAAPTTTTTTAAPTTKAPTTANTGGRTLLEYDTTGHYVQPAGAAWNLLLVNDWNPLSSGYENGVTLVDVGKNQRADQRIQADLTAMLEAGKAYGIGVQSGYRPASQQSVLYWRQVDRFLANGSSNTAAQTAAGKIVKRPGYSEHNCGLALDLGGSGNFKLEEDFAQTPAYSWLIKHCAEYGFILRFPKDKQTETGVIYEPWHYRYVGKEVATEIMSKGLCLEEYLEQTNQ